MVERKGSQNIFQRTILFFLILSVTSGLAKRFDCRMFCRETGFHGMVGGCRCSFTLFTAKRAIRYKGQRHPSV